MKPEAPCAARRGIRSSSAGRRAGQKTPPVGGGRTHNIKSKKSWSKKMFSAKPRKKNDRAQFFNVKIDYCCNITARTQLCGASHSGPGSESQPPTGCAATTPSAEPLAAETELACSCATGACALCRTALNAAEWRCCAAVRRVSSNGTPAAGARRQLRKRRKSNRRSGSLAAGPIHCVMNMGSDCNPAKLHGQDSLLHEPFIHASGWLGIACCCSCVLSSVCVSLVELFEPE